MHPALAGKSEIDIIGDVHGCHDALLRLLTRLGYKEMDGVMRHPRRLAVFVGDLIDRGPGIRETLHLVERMHQAGTALVILGNHEYNAVRYSDQLLTFLVNGDEGDLPLRLLKLMDATLDQFANYPDEWEHFCRWFGSLPLFLEGDGYRIVHACWDKNLISEYRQRYSVEGINDEFVTRSKERGSFESRVVDRLTRGTSMPLPDGMQLQSKDGFIRRFFRTKFWATSPKTYGDVVFQPDPLPYDLAEHPIKSHHREDLLHYPDHALPVFFGHYWLKGRPRPLQDNVACLDYSAVNFGRLTAYRYQGEKVLREENFTWVYVDPE